MKTDIEIKDDIIDEFSFDPAVDAAGIGVAVRNGVVTLTGQVATLGEKYAARNAAQRISGVKAVAVDIEVNLGQAHVRGDTEIAAAAQRALSWNSQVPVDQVKIAVDNGIVTLSGNVEWAFQRKAAARSVGHLMGVRGLNNTIAVKSRASSSNISAEIEAALKRQAEREAHRIQVSVAGSVVTVRGKVRTLAEERAVVGAAYNATGVTDVIDEIEIG